MKLRSLPVALSAIVALAVLGGICLSRSRVLLRWGAASKLPLDPGSPLLEDQSYLPLAMCDSAPTPAPPVTEPFYGMEYVPQGDLGKVAALGVEVVLSTFPRDETPDSWLGYLDEADAHDIKVVARMWPEGWNWDGHTWQIDARVRSFIQTIARHPATLAVYTLEEPYWQGCWGCGYTTREQQALYDAVKAIADVPIFSEVDSMSFWTAQGEETAFAEGICDYCAAWYYPFRTDGTYQREELITRLQADLSVARERAPNAQFVWLMQAFAQDESSLRMPSADELCDLAALVYSMDIDGALWYPWQFGSLYSDTLGEHPELYPVIREIYENHVLPAKR